MVKTIDFPVDFPWCQSSDINPLVNSHVTNWKITTFRRQTKYRWANSCVTIYQRVHVAHTMVQHVVHCYDPVWLLRNALPELSGVPKQQSHHFTLAAEERISHNSLFSHPQLQSIILELIIQQSFYQFFLLYPQKSPQIWQIWTTELKGR